MKSSIAKLISLAIAVTGTSMANANESVYPAHLENDLVNICEATKKNNLVKFKRAVKASRLNYRVVEKGLVCNGVGVLKFAIENESKSTALFIARQANIDEQEVLARLNKSSGKMSLGE